MPMQELRLVAVSEDGTYAVLAVPGRGGRFVLPIDDRLRTVARGQFSRLAQYEIEVENPLRPKEIQDRIRAGETADEIADAAGIPIDRVRRFEGPVLAEREYRAREAQRSTVRGHTESGPGPRLGEIVLERLAEAGALVDTLAWDSRKRTDGNWQVQVQFIMDGHPQLAEWVFDPRRRHVIPADDLARRLCLPPADWPVGRPGRVSAAATATVTPINSRLGAHYSDARADAQAEPDRALARATHN
ncbi:MAG: septation protein SepH, partial [Streptosporangiaceae bacterium]